MPKAASRITRSAAAMTPQKRSAKDIFDVPESSPEKSRKRTSKQAEVDPKRISKGKNTKSKDQGSEAVPSGTRRQSKRISGQPAKRSRSSGVSKAKAKANTTEATASGTSKRNARTSQPIADQAVSEPSSSRSDNRSRTDAQEDGAQNDDDEPLETWEDDGSQQGNSGLSVIPKLDRENLWGKIIACAKNLTQGTNYRSKMFKEIHKRFRQIQEAARTSTTVDELRDRLTAAGDPATKICEELQDFHGDHRSGEARDFSNGGLKVLIRTVSQLIRYHKPTLEDSEDTFLLGIVNDLVRETIDFADHARGKGIYTRPEISTVANLRFFAKILSNELQARQHAKGTTAFYARYEKAHKELKEREDRQLERFRRLNARPRSSLGAAAEQEETAAKGSETSWTEMMDQELVNGLYEFRDRPARERYLSCLTSPLLQELSDERIRRRALVCRPSLIAWYEDQDQTAPAWVTSIT